MQYIIMVVARTILLISLVVQEGKQWIELWGGGGGGGGVVGGGGGGGGEGGGGGRLLEAGRLFSN